MNESKPLEPSEPLQSQIKTMESKEKMEKVSGLSRVFNPPKLEKKHSSGDLISRLKTRKILGVGETDGGDVHRSKISQVLGHNEHLYVKLPRGFWLTHILLGSEISLEAILFLFAPSIASSLYLWPSKIDDQNCYASSTRAAGAALCGLVVFIWSFIGMNDKRYAKAILSSILTYHAICLLLSIVTGFYQEERFWKSPIQISFSLRAFFSCICIAYLYNIANFAPIRGNRFSNNSRCQESKDR